MVAQVVDAISFWVIPFVTDPSAPTVQGAVGWQALGRIEESGVPAWFDFLDASVGGDYCNDFHRPSESYPFSS